MQADSDVHLEEDDLNNKVYRTFRDINHQMKSHCLLLMEKESRTLLPNQILMGITGQSRCNCNQGDFIKKKINQIRQMTIPELKDLAEKQVVAFKSALKYNCDLTTYYCTGKYNREEYPTCPTSEDFLSLKNNQCSAERLAIIYENFVKDALSQTHFVLSEGVQIEGSVAAGQRLDVQKYYSLGEWMRYDDETANKMSSLQAQLTAKNVPPAKPENPSNIKPIKKKHQDKSEVRTGQKEIRQRLLSNDSNDSI